MKCAPPSSSAAVGAKAGEKAGAVVLSKVLFGGLLSGVARKKGKELGAYAAVGGADFVRKSSSYSFSSLQDMALYMHANCPGNTDHLKALAASLAIHPEIGQSCEVTIKNAYALK